MIKDKRDDNDKRDHSAILLFPDANRKPVDSPVTGGQARVAYLPLARLAKELSRVGKLFHFSWPGGGNHGSFSPAKGI